MKTIKLLLVFLLSIPYTINAQDEVADYKQFETLAKKINAIQLATNGKKVKNNNDDIAIKNPKNNFMFNYNDLTVNYINGIEGALLVYENMDLAEIEEVGILDEAIGECGMVILTPKNKQKYTIVVDGKPTREEIDAIGFYFPYNDKAKGKEMFEALSDLVLLSKQKKGKLSKNSISDLKKKWKETEAKNTAKDYFSFYNKEPDNIYTNFAYYRLTNLDKSFNIDKIDLESYKLGMSKNDFEEIFYKKLKNITSENEVVKEVINNFKIPYGAVKDSKYSTYFYFVKDNTGVPNRKINKVNNELNSIKSMLLSVPLQKISSKLPDVQANYLNFYFDTNDKLIEIVIDLPLYNNGVTKENFLESFITSFGEPRAISDTKRYYTFWGYAEKEMTLFFTSLNSCWITIRYK